MLALVFVSLVTAWEGVLPSAVVIEDVIYWVNDDDSLTSTYGTGIDLTVGEGDKFYYKNGTIAYTPGIGDDKGKLYKGDGTSKEVVFYKGGYLDSKGNVVDENNDKIWSRPEAEVIEGVIYKVNLDDSLEAADGTILTVDDDTGIQRYLYKDGTVAYAFDNDGKLYKGSGDSKEVVEFLQGYYLDSKGNVVDENNKVKKSIFGPYVVAIEGVIYNLNSVDDSLVAVVDGTVLKVGKGDNFYYKNGTIAYTNGNVRGKLYKGDGTTKKLVPYFGGYLSEGNIVNRDGKHAKGLEVVVIEGVIYTVNEDDSLEAADGTVLTVGDGDNLWENGTIAFTIIKLKGEKGKLYKGDGTTKEEVWYEAGFLAWNGNVVDGEGNVIYCPPKSISYRVVIEKVIYNLDGDNNFVPAEGTTVLAYGDGGNLYYKNNTIAYTFGDDGKLYKGSGTTKEEISYNEGTLDSNGNVVDDEGNIIAKGNAGNEENAGSKTLVPTLLVVLILALLL